MEQECASIANNRSHRWKTEDRLPPKQQCNKKINIKVFLIETQGPRWDDGLVFTVIAEDHVWAKEMVHQWLDSNCRQYDKIDKIHVLVSQDVRAIVSVGAKLLEV